MLTDERGMTVIEVLVASVCGLIVAAAAMAFVVISLHQQNTVASRASISRQAETGLEQMVRDVRQAMSQDATGNALTAVVSTSASAQTTSMQVYIPSPGNDSSGQLVTWTCPSTAEASTYIGTCYRQLGASGASETMITGVQSATFSPVDSSGTSHILSPTANSSFSNPASVAITLNLQVVSQADSSGSHTVSGTGNTVTISTTADLRNFS